MDQPQLSARDVAHRAMRIAADKCIYVSRRRAGRPAQQRRPSCFLHSCCNCSRGQAWHWAILGCCCCCRRRLCANVRTGHPPSSPLSPPCLTTPAPPLRRALLACLRQTNDRFLWEGIGRDGAAMAEGSAGLGPPGSAAAAPADAEQAALGRSGGSSSPGDEDSSGSDAEPAPGQEPPARPGPVAAAV
jgi:hypothetical protein